MGITTNFKLPYPEKNDIANIPEDIKELAESVENVINEINECDGSKGGILAGTVVGWNGEGIPEGYEEVENPFGNQGWESVSANINTVYFSGGDILYKKIGKMVILFITDIIVKTKLDGYNLLLASGLPPSQTRHIFMLNGTNGQDPATINNLRITIDENGNLGNWYDYKSANTGIPYYGEFIYFTN